MQLNYRDPKLWAVAAAALFALWYWFLRKPSAATGTPAGEAVTPQSSPNYAPGTSSESGSGGSEAAPAGADLLNSIGDLVDSILGQQSVFSNFALGTQQQVFDFARDTSSTFAGIAMNANNNLADVASSRLNDPQVITLFLAHDQQPTQVTSAAVPSIAPTPSPPSTFSPNYSVYPATQETFTSGAATVNVPGGIIGAYDERAGTVSSGGLTLTPAQQAVRQASGRGPQA